MFILHRVAIKRYFLKKEKNFIGMNDFIVTFAVPKLNEQWKL